MDTFKHIDYDNCITNLTSSIEKHFNLPPHYKTNKVVDDLLIEKDYENVILIVFDALGNSIIDKNTTENHFLQKHRISTMSSTYPPTTANCTICYQTGLNPITTGWLGWSTYYKDLDLAIDNFPNVNSITKEVILGDNIAERKMPLSLLGDRIASNNKDVSFYSVWPSFKENGCKSLKEFEHRIIKLCNQPGRKFIYAYWSEPDSSMHEEGTSTPHIKKILNDIGKSLHRIQRKTKNTIAIISADHSQVDVTPIALYTYYDLLDCLYAPFSCDSRTPFFFVKEERKEEFVRLFNQYFDGKYKLFSKQEIIDNHVFGYGDEHPLFKDIIGDYVGVAIDKYFFLQTPDYPLFKGHHAGALKEEASIPIIVIKN